VEEIGAIIRNIKNDAAKVMVLVAAASALRRSEIRGLKWKDLELEDHWINLKRGYVRQHQTYLKTEASRKGLPMHPDLANVLTEWRKKTPYPMPDDWVFASPFTEGKRPYWPESAMVDYVRPAAVAAGITKTINRPGFRHSLGTLMKSNGEDVKTIQELLRHANSRITLDVYTQGNTESKREALNSVSGIFVVSKKAA
jgi:integrase